MPIGKPVTPALLIVRALSAKATTGVLTFGPLQIRCALGRSGKRWRKHEGDGASPSGTWTVRQAYYRADRLTRPKTSLKLTAIAPNAGWCDDSCDRNYNSPVTHPYPASAEHLWREDGLYDLIVVLGYNDTPRVKGRGSAIFLHVARSGYAPTEGCIAVARPDLIRLLAAISPKTKLVIS